jgi:Asp-tRNA(Asn)/Glu-tRNA(Gln) amidotransferase A subunit family amidase
VWREFFLSTAEPETAEFVEHAIERFRQAGAEIVDLPLPAGFADVHVMHRRIMAHDAAIYHRQRYGAPRAGYGPKMAGLIVEGLAIGEREYEQAISHQEAFRAALDAMLAEVDVVVTPATPGPAPADLTTTGDPRFNSPFSHAGVPTLSVPLAVAESGLPIGLQFVGRMWNEVPLAITAMWCQDRTEDEQG